MITNVGSVAEESGVKRPPLLGRGHLPQRIGFNQNQEVYK